MADERQGTHWDGCWMVHHECAAIKVPGYCDCPCHDVIQPDLIPCPNCEHISRYERPDA